MFDLENKLFDDIGERIKRSAVGLFITNAILIAIAAAIGMIVSLGFLFDGDSFGGLWFVLTPFCAVIEILLFLLPMEILYGFGELVSNSTKLAYPENESAPKSYTNSETPNTPLSKISNATPLVTEKSQQEEAWNCPKCGKPNHPQRATCRHCDAPKPQATPKKASTTPIVQESLGMQANAAGWTCKSCGKANHPSRTTCRHCGADQ